jgi:hypothetical protein
MTAYYPLSRDKNLYGGDRGETFGLGGRERKEGVPREK